MNLFLTITLPVDVVGRRYENIRAIKSNVNIDFDCSCSPLLRSVCAFVVGKKNQGENTFKDVISLSVSKVRVTKDLFSVFKVRVTKDVFSVTTTRSPERTWKKDVFTFSVSKVRVTKDVFCTMTARSTTTTKSPGQTRKTKSNPKLVRHHLSPPMKNKQRFNPRRPSPSRSPKTKHQRNSMSPKTKSSKTKSPKVNHQPIPRNVCRIWRNKGYCCHVKCPYKHPKFAKASGSRFRYSK